MGFAGLPLQLELLATRRPVWRVVSDLQYRGKDFSVDVPGEWVTDLTSIPWWIPFLGREGKHTPASVVHDVVYAKGRVQMGEDETEVERIFADREVYLQAMEELETPRLRRKVIYWGSELAAGAYGENIEKSSFLNVTARPR